MPGSTELVSTELEGQLAPGQGLLRILERNPQPLVPDDHLAGAVVALGNHPLEVGVIDGMVLDLDGQPLVRRVQRGPHGDGPGAQDAAQLDTEVVVQASGSVLLDAEEARARPLGCVRRRSALRPTGLAAEGLGGPVRRTLPAIGVQPVSLVGPGVSVGLVGHVLP